jgi:hypothetical protein
VIRNTIRNHPEQQELAGTAESTRWKAVWPFLKSPVSSEAAASSDRVALTPVILKP